MAKLYGIRKTKDGIDIYAPSDFEGMRKAGAVAAKILDDVIEVIEPGQTTVAIDNFVEQKIVEYGVTSATIGYRGYQHATCISVNHVVCHGIPGDKKITDGDILNIDVTVIVDGWYGDTSRMYVAGKLPRKSERLIQVTHDALFKGIEMVRPGAQPLVILGTQSNPMSKETACLSSVIFVVMVWVGCFTRLRMCCTTDVRARVRCWKRACFSPLNPW